MHLLLYASSLLTASALNIQLQPRGECEDIQDNQLVYNDGPTADGTAGIGAEFESPFFKLVKKDCSLKDTNDAKKSLIEGRKGLNWQLTADSTGNAGELHAEYILDGRNIQVGSQDGAKAGKAISDDLIGWAPWKGDGARTLNIDNNKCNPWNIDMSKTTKPETLPWSPQITAPMPLEALYSLMEENLADPDEKNILDGSNFHFPKDKLVLVKKDYFESKPNNIDASKITDDVLAFCTLVLSYAKAATVELKPDQSPKLFIAFMPRTEFNTMFQIVKPKLTGDLFSLFNTLACYNTKQTGEVVLDKNYCTGTMSKPIPGDKFSGLKYTNTAPEPDVTVNIKDWIQGIGKADPSPDLLSKFDQSVDSSIGGFGTTMEKMYNSQRAAPLIEFRDLEYKQTNQIEQFMKDVDSAIQKLHKDFADAPTKKKRDVPGCTPPDNATQSTPPDKPTQTTQPDTAAQSATPTQSNPPVVTPVDPPSQPSCVPNPTDSVKDAHEGELKKAAKYFCDEHATDTNAKAPIKNEATIIAGTKQEGRAIVDIAYVYPESLGNQDDVYDFSLTSVDNCTPVNGFNLASPVANSKCADILHDAWKNCNNKGRGGQITAGCLTYSVKTRY